MNTLSPDQLDDLTVDLVFALRDSLTDEGPSRLDFWDGRVATAIETAAAGAQDMREAISIAARKLQIDTLTKDAAATAVRVANQIDDYQQWASHVARNLVYIIALARVANDTKKATASAKRGNITTTQQPAF